MSTWKEVFLKARELGCDVKPLMALRFIQLIEYAFSKGWASPKQWDLIQKVMFNFKFVVHQSWNITFNPKESYIGLQKLYQEMRSDTLLQRLPHNHSCFKESFKMHFKEFPVNLSCYSLEILKISPKIFIKHFSTSLPSEMPLEKTLETTTERKFSIIKSNDLQPIIEKRLLRPCTWRESIPAIFLDGLCLKINEFTSNMELFKGTSFQILLTPLYSRKVSYHCYLHASASQIVDLYMTDLNNNLLDEGNESQVYKSQQFSIFSNPTLNASLSIRYSRMVRIIPKKILNEEVVDDLLHTDKIKCILQQKPTKMHLTKRIFFNAVYPYNNFQMYEEWVNSTLHHVHLNGMKIPEDFSPSAPCRLVKIRELFLLLKDGAKRFKEMHDTGMGHLDVKPKNLLIGIDENGILKFIPTDFSKCDAFHLGSPTGDDAKRYYYWDLLTKQKGTVLPYADWYGLIISTAEIVIPNFFFIVASGDNALENWGQHKSESHRSFIRLYRDLINKLTLPSEKSMNAICKAIENYVTNNPSLHIEDLRAICEIANRAKAIDFAFELLHEAYLAERRNIKNLSDFLKEAEPIFRKGSIQDKITLLDKYSLGPKMMEDLITRIQIFQNKLDAYSSSLIPPNP